MTFNVAVLFKLDPNYLCKLYALLVIWFVSYMVCSVRKVQKVYQDRSTILVSFYFCVRYVVTNLSEKPAVSFSFAENRSIIFLRTAMFTCLLHTVIR